MTKLTQNVPPPNGVLESPHHAVVLPVRPDVGLLNALELHTAHATHQVVLVTPIVQLGLHGPHRRVDPEAQVAIFADFGAGLRESLGKQVHLNVQDVPAQVPYQVADLCELLYVVVNGMIFGTFGIYVFNKNV